MKRVLIAATTVVLSLIPATAFARPAPEPGVVASELPQVQVADLEASVPEMVAYVEAVQRDEVGRYLTAVAESERLAAEEAERARARSTPSYSGGTTVGECTGFAIPDYIIQRESGGNPSAMNPSGAYGCAQTLLSHYYGGSCSGLDPYSIDGQRQCVLILSDGGTNLQPWALTR